MKAGLRRVGIVVVAALALTVVAGIAGADRASAHPLGNFTINTYSRLDFYADAVRVTYAVDMAEIPAFQERAGLDADGDGELTAAEERAYLGEMRLALAEGLRLSLDGSRVPLSIRDAFLERPAGAGGLETLRLELIFDAPFPDGAAAAEVAYQDDNFAGRIGWREIVIRGARGVRVLGADAYAHDRSNVLRAYPEDLLSSPPRDLSVTFAVAVGPSAEAAPGAPGASGPAGPQEVSRSAFVGLINVGELTLVVVLVSLMAAFGFGALHALEPGHGKAFVAAYFIGVGGTARQAFLFGVVVAVSHAVGVFVIGLLVLVGSQYILPERIYPWLSLGAGLFIVGLGVAMIVDRLGGTRGVTQRLRRHHHHGPHHHHADHASRSGSGRPSWRGLLLLGLVDGFVPSPSTLVLLLAAVSLNRIELGALLIVAFSLGLATVLSGIAATILAARGLARRWRRPTVGVGAAVSGWAGERLMVRAVPFAAAAVLVAVGLLYSLRALATPGLSL